MTSLSKLVAMSAATLVLGMSASAAMAATVINVDLWDKSGAEMRTDLAFPSTPAAHAQATMGIKLSQDSAKAGVISFHVKNDSSDTVHEMVIALVKDPTKALPYSVKDQEVIENKIAYKGEVSELDPGKSGIKTLSLAPGEYLLLCNAAGHFADGMWTTFTVTK